VPFARYIARSGVTYLKRYSIDSVYRESRLAGLHPRELAACSFDIVTTPGSQSFVADAEVIAIVSEIVHEIPNLAARNCQLRVNHTALVKAMLLHCGVAESLHADIYAILGDSKVCVRFLLALNFSIHTQRLQVQVPSGPLSSNNFEQYLHLWGIIMKTSNNNRRI